MIALLDYGSGNLRSVEKALRSIGTDVQIMTGPSRLLEANGVVLPGVGAFDDCIRALERQELLQPVKKWIASGRPFLGICVGYQALFEGSEEFNSTAPGLGVLAGRVVRFPAKPSLKVPQIGWNQLEIVRPDCPLFRGVPSGSYVYFVHSYFPQPADGSVVAAQTNYGLPFAAAVWQGQTFATQFHPEKSQRIGLRILQNFVELSEAKPEGNVSQAQLSS